MTSVAEQTLELVPRARFELIDLAPRLEPAFRERFRRAIYCSHHTTAGFLDQSLAARLQHRRDSLDGFLRAFHKIFPRGADYLHDNLPMRSELSPEQRQVEPKNGDSHLTFIGSGLKSCVTYRHREPSPIYLVELDGIHEGTARRRKTTVIGYQQERVAARAEIAVPVSTHAVDVINLRDPEHGVFAQLEELVRRTGVGPARLDLSLAPDEKSSGLTVNEYETLLMKHDLSAVLRDPLRFMAEKGRHALRNPLAVPSKTMNYASYDLPFLFREVMQVLRLGDSSIERLAARLTGGAASRFLRLRRSLSLVVTGEAGPRVLLGQYQSPILLQWAPTGGARKLVATLVALE